MVLTAPGYGLAMRSWIRLDPATTWWAQLPAFVLGLLGDPRRLRPRPLAAQPAVAGVRRGARRHGEPARGPVRDAGEGVPLRPARRVRDPRARRAGPSCPVDTPTRGRSPSRPSRRSSSPRGARPSSRAPGSPSSLALARRRSAAAAARRVRSSRRSLVRSSCGRSSCARCPGAHHQLASPRVPRRLPVARRAPSAASRSSSAASSTRVFAYPVPVSFYRGTPGVHDAGALAVGVVLLAVAILVPLVASIRRRRHRRACLRRSSLARRARAQRRGPRPAGRRADRRGPLPRAPRVPRRRRASGRRRTSRRAIGAGAPARAASASARRACSSSARCVFGVDHTRGVPDDLASRRGRRAREARAARRRRLRRHLQLVRLVLLRALALPGPGRRDAGVAAGLPARLHDVGARSSPATTACPSPSSPRRRRGRRASGTSGTPTAPSTSGAARRTTTCPVPTFFTGLLRSDGWRREYGLGTQVLGVHAYAVLFVRAGRR